MEGEKTFTIGRLAKAASVNIQTVRFYEREGILRPFSRKASGYRVYDEESLKRLVFVRRAKTLGFSLKEINNLLGLRARSVEQCDKVRAKADDKLQEVREKIKHLKFLEKTLKRLVSECESRSVPNCCPIIEKIELDGLQPKARAFPRKP
ncbi:MAG: heavy metal-responsive transcriptional regulator [Nitrospinae bacterium]|nr:heavy metal-responsive transcriptional regulator [Nitrospinota bacterium]